MTADCSAAAVGPAITKSGTCDPGQDREEKIGVDLVIFVSLGLMHSRRIGETHAPNILVTDRQRPRESASRQQRPDPAHQPHRVAEVRVRVVP